MNNAAATPTDHAAAPRSGAESRVARLELRGVGKSFGRGVEVLRAVDLRVDAGEIVGFVGPNGAGKSTCMRICIGILARDAGEARVHGLDPGDHGLAVRRRTSYLPGEASIYHQMTGAQFVEFARYGYPPADDVLRSAPALFDLPMHQSIRNYSGGMKQRLALRAALGVDVDLYILDEPDRALDASARLQLREVLLALRAQGKSVLLSSHHLTEIDAIADRSVFLLGGRIVPDATIQAARAELQCHVRLRRRPDAVCALPGGAIPIEATPDGGQRLRVVGDPIAWLAQIPREDLLTAEIGATRLEDLYRLLTDDESTAAPRGIASATSDPPGRP